MTSLDRQAHFDTERCQLRAAAQRLLAGTPQRSNGTLTVSSLATEAGLPRQRLYEHHPDIVAEFKTTAGTGPISPNVQALQQQLAGAHHQITELETVNRSLRSKITALAAVITELTHGIHADNVVALPPRRRRGP